MFQVGEHVLYGLHGVCKIDKIEGKKFDDEVHDYYILKPVFDKGSTVFVSIHKKELTDKMIPLLSCDEIKSLINTLPELESFWIENESDRKEQFKLIIESDNRVKQLSILKAILLHRMHLISIKRKMHNCDEILLKNVEKRIYEEFSFVLDKTKEDLANTVYSLIGFSLDI